jgi:Domain of unknown function (DUF1707)
VGRVRLTDAEREQLFENLKRHAAEGRLDVAELERRVAVVAEAESREDAAGALADLPPLGDPGSPARSGRPRWGRGHGESDAPAPDWQPTGERFRDPRSGKVMRVWVDAAGARHYVAERD